MITANKVDHKLDISNDTHFTYTPKAEFFGLTRAAQEIFSACWDLDRFLEDNQIFQDQIELDKKRAKLFKKHQNQQLEAALNMLERAGYNCFDLTVEDIANLLVSDALLSQMKTSYENTDLTKYDLLKDFITVNKFGSSFFDSTLAQRIWNKSQL